MKIVSACLLGIKCRYDGKRKNNKGILKLAKKEIFIPVCPEQLGGLPTPRESAERKGKKVFTKLGKNVTRQFNLGAREVLRIVKTLNVKKAILKQKSPSCGSGKIYDGSFSGKIKKGNGITAALLKKNGIKIITEENL